VPTGWGSTQNDAYSGGASSAGGVTVTTTFEQESMLDDGVELQGRTRDVQRDGQASTAEEGGATFDGYSQEVYSSKVSITAGNLDQIVG
jgi:hypothetical protein